MQFTPEMLWEPPVLWNINSSVHVSLPPTSMSNLGCIHQNRSYQPLLGGEGQYSIIEWSTMGRLYPALIELEDIHKDHFTIKINWRVKPVE